VLAKIEVKADLYKLLREALLVHNGDTDPESIETRYDLFTKIHDQTEIELDEEERKLLIDLCCSKFDVIFTGQVIKLLK